MSCANCGHEYHQGPLYKTYLDGDGREIVIEVCKTGRKQDK